MGQKLVAAGIPKSTLYDWMKQFTRDPSWRPYHCLRSRSKRIFTDEEEHAIADYIVENGLNKQCLISLDFENNKVTVKSKY